MKVVINAEYGGFWLSNEELKRLEEEGLDPAMSLSCPEFRSDPRLVKLVEEKIAAMKSGGYNTSLKIVDVPDDVSWHIEEYDGAEWVAEDHRTWG